MCIYWIKRNWRNRNATPLVLSPIRISERYRRACGVDR